MLPVQLGAGDLRRLLVEAPWLVAGLTRSAAPRRPLRRSFAPCSRTRSQRWPGRVSPWAARNGCRRPPAAVCNRGCSRVRPTLQPAHAANQGCKAVPLLYATTHRGANIYISLRRRSGLSRHTPTSPSHPGPASVSSSLASARLPVPSDTAGRLVAAPPPPRRLANIMSIFSYPALASALRLRPPGEVRVRVRVTGSGSETILPWEGWSRHA